MNFIIKTLKHTFQKNKSDIIKNKEKLKMTIDNFEVEYVTHTMTSRIMKSVHLSLIYNFS